MADGQNPMQVQQLLQMLAQAGSAGPMQFQLPQLQQNPLSALGPLAGFMPMPGGASGAFAGAQNPFDQIRAIERQRIAMEGVSKGTAGDLPSFMSFMSGGHKIFNEGQDMNAEQRGMLQAGFNQFAPSVLPMMGMMAPRFTDAMMGAEGSSTVFASTMGRMSGKMRDPVTGQVGMSADSIGGVSNAVKRHLYGDEDSRHAMRGIGMGQAGLIMEQMAIRSELAPTGNLASMSEKEQARKLGMSGDQLSESKSSGEFDRLAQSFDANKISQAMKEKAGAIRAIQEMFGDAGVTDAPIPMIMSALENLTQGGGGMTGAQAENLVRRTKGLAKQAGLTVQTIGALSGQAVQMGNRPDLQLDPSLAPNAAASAMAFQARGQQAGLAAPAFGAGDMNSLRHRHMQLQQQAAASPAANQLNATVRIGEMQGFREGTEAAAMAAAIKRGSDTYEFGGEQKSVNVRPTEWKRIMRDSGVKESTAMTAVRQRFANQEFAQGMDEEGNRFDTADLVRKEQFKDVSAVIGGSFGHSIERALADAGMDGNTAAAVSRRAGIATSQKMSSMTEDELRRFADPKEKQALTAKMMKQATLESLQARGMSREQAEAATDKMDFNAAAMTGLGSAEQRIRTSPYLQGYGSLIDTMRLQNRDFQGKVVQAGAEADQFARIEGALSGIAEGDHIKRITDMIRKGETDQGVLEAAAQAIGAVPTKAIEDATKDVKKTMQLEIEREKELLAKGDRSAKGRIQAREKALDRLNRLTTASDEAARIAEEDKKDIDEGGVLGELTRVKEPGEGTVLAPKPGPAPKSFTERMLGMSAQGRSPATASAKSPADTRKEGGRPGKVEITLKSGAIELKDNRTAQITGTGTQEGATEVVEGDATAMAVN